MANKLDGNPWLKMWTSPRDTIRGIVNTNPDQNLLWLAGIYGFLFLLRIFQMLSFSSVWPLTAIIIVSLVLAPFVGWICFYIFTGLLLWTGRWIGGKAKFKEARAAVAWPNVTGIVGILTWIALIITFQGGLFVSTFDQMQFMGTELTVVLATSLCQAIVSVWAFVIFLHALGEVQGFSAWKALLNLILVLIVFTVVGWFLFSLVLWTGVGAA